MVIARSSNLLGKVTVFFVICLLALPAWAKYGGGTGDPNDPFLIYTAEQMNAIGADSNDWDKHFLLCADIDLSAFTGTSFNIIGTLNPTLPFTGVFDGNGHTISNFTYESILTGCIGLFGYVYYGDIRNLGLIDSSVSAREEVGSLVGWLDSGTITNCYATGSVAGEIYVGGLVGQNGGTINNSYSAATAIGNNDVGGLVGSNICRATIINCYANGNVKGTNRVGGLAGSNIICGIGAIPFIANTYSTGSVEGTGSEIGGLVGYDVTGRISHSFWDIETSGHTSSAGGVGKTTEQMQMAQTYNAWVECRKEPTWILNEGNDYPRLKWQNLQGIPLVTPAPDYGGGSGTPSDPYLIETADQFNTLGLTFCDWDKHFKLMADIDLSAYSVATYSIIGNVANHFTGVFDGNGHTIFNFTYTSTDRNIIGLFGYVSGENSEIKNLGLIDPNVDAGTGINVGSLVGWLYYGTISNCYVEGGSVKGDHYVGGLVGEDYKGTITNCYSNGIVLGGFRVGGLVGWDNKGTIVNSYSTGSVSGATEIGGLVGENFRDTITNCYSTVSVMGDECVGGLVGWNDEGTIVNGYSNGSVSGATQVGGLVGANGWCSYWWGCFPGTIINCYSTGSVSGDFQVGGLVGLNKSGPISASFWDIETSGRTTSDGGTGKTTAEMQMTSTFMDAGWDFDTPVWTIYDGVDYPRLWWEGMKVPMKMTPVSLNCRSEGNWVKAHLTLPEGFTVEDVDPDKLAILLHSFGFESTSLYVFINKDKVVEIEAAFERQDVCSLVGNWPEELTVVGFLADGNIFLGTSNVRIIHPGMKVIEELADCWLQEDCVYPETDMNRDSLVNLLDYALLMNINIEFVTDE